MTEYGLKFLILTFTLILRFHSIPKYKLILEGGSFVNLNIKAEYYEMINTPSKPCNNSAEYSFTKCAKVKKDFEDCFSLPKK